ncbi:aminotransferase class III-fold pyridoxal phosphate-dependent enzyme [Sphingomonas sp. AP4-R1]|uniref:aminotransferase class III-fold pyridoxal phosphate-dependent enzyme n=1 Tax=Sphingomonas sp. AP4-R1 TaxID=2735134 RepID=UPI0014934C40|nr:aminotransferase class III-fold pyridoxal phosphate-dependent enzyme [Sphingomonas sp. AP4-R1]QJU60019.1 aminotransferase class III-fold pyridoxal phosphate-dependent enzyme [Sphingomonas sp. AP4-R1]
MIPTFALVAGAAVTALGADKARRRLILSKAKHPSLAGHVRWGKRIAGQIPATRYDEAQAFHVDDAPADIVAARRAGFDRLAALFAERFAKTRALTAEARSGLSDLQFTGSYRVPFQFAQMISTALSAGTFYERSEGPILTDLDGNRLWDLTGSYGVNVLGNDTYKTLMREAIDQAEPLGGVLAGLHPLVADNVARLKALSGMDEVSFHMSGTEAVMQAVRLARYHTRRSHLVRFVGAYHGWWGDVQPGIGNPVPADGTYTLADMSEKSLRVLRTKKNIACVLVNPLQALHPNKGAPSDGSLVAGRQVPAVDRAAYAAWLKRLAETCRENDIVLILDDVFTGFRLAPHGAAEYFDVQPDLVTYGKTLGGGFPVGVLCGKAALMRRFRDDRPVDICFARGTFNAHPYVMAAMNGFLRLQDQPATRALYDGLDERWNGRAAAFNAKLEAAGLPVRVANLSSIWTVLHTAPSRYNWILQYYLRAEGLALSWVGTGRLIFSLDYDDAAFAEVADRFVAAAEKMKADGWFWHPDGATNKTIGRTLLREAIAKRLGRN